MTCLFWPPTDPAAAQMLEIHRGPTEGLAQIETVEGVRAITGWREDATLTGMAGEERVEFLHEQTGEKVLSIHRSSAGEFRVLIPSSDSGSDLMNDAKCTRSGNRS
jgi:hypothetical protein